MENLHLPYEIVEANENHGVYVIDCIGATVCDFYFIDNSKKGYFEFPNAELNAEMFVDYMNRAVI